MSNITNAILTASPMEEDDGEAAIRYVNEHVGLFAHGAGRFARVDQYSGPGWAFEAVVYIAALNHLRDIDCLIETVASAAWQSPESVRLFLKGDEDDGFTLVWPRPART